MEKLGLNEIREKFLSFFESKGHLRLPSFPLVPQNDASLLLINAGMAPLKPYFTGKEIPPRSRVTTCQKCIRTPDIERVGKTARHGTFFEMLGNFSFGDYFKNEATAWAWEFITKVLELPEDKLWVTIYEDDDEAFEIWTKKVGIPADRIVRMGKDDNFWEIGQGPCGPCSEIYFDRGPEHGCGSPDCAVGCECDRFVEFWNLVFTQFDKDENGNYNRLAHPNIDTGMGLERIAAIMQDVDNLFEVDTIRNIMKRIIEFTGVKYHENEKTDVSLRVITDHIRSTTFMISDNISPSNEGRGYVLRRLLRRAARHGKLLGLDKPFLYKIADTVIDESKGAYPELEAKREYIKKIIKTEEERFDETIDTGLSILSSYIDELRAENKTILDGENAFKLYDTYGFPIDLTIEILEENGMTVDRDGFDHEMTEQRERARNARSVGDEAGWSEDIFSTLPKDSVTEFTGYDNLETTAHVTAIVCNGEIVDSANDGADAAIITDKTVFYGESGGEVGDHGTMFAPGFSGDVFDCKKLHGNKTIHFTTINEGSISIGDEIKLSVDKKVRRAVARNHSATHLLQKALREVLGEHVAQAGSFVNSERLRFDFSHFEAMTPEQIAEVEQRVNNAIFEAMPVTKEYMSMDDAKKTGAMALFGEKYGDTVRVVKMGDYSTELCGGCHVNNTSEIVLFKILSESSAAAGVRRIEAITGEAVLNQLNAFGKALSHLADIMKVPPHELEERARNFIEEMKNNEKALAKLKSKMALMQLDNILTNVKTVDGVKIICAQIDGLDNDTLLSISDRIKENHPCSVSVLASVTDGKILFVSAATKEAVAKGVHAGKIIKDVAKIAGGGGGGKPDSARAGGKDISKIDNALAIVDELVAEQIKK